MQKVKQKILFIITQSEMGGAQRFVLDMAGALTNDGYNISVAASGNGTLLKNCYNMFRSEHIVTEGKTIKTTFLKYLKRSPGPIKAIFAISEMRKLIKQEKPDVLFLCSTMAGILGSIAGRKRVSKIIYRIGGWAFNDPRPKWQKKLIIFLEKITSQYKNKIIVNSEFDLQSALAHKIASQDKLIKIYNGIDPTEIEFLEKKQARQELGVSTTQPIIGTIANFYKTKGLAHLITASKHIDAQIVIIGDGKERQNLENSIKKYNLQDKVKLLGQKPNARKYLKAFDVFVLPSLKEGFPWVILETMASQVPIIATSVGAIPEIIQNNQSGFVIPPADSQILSKKIQDLLSSPELRNKFTQNATLRLSLFSKQHMIIQTKDIKQ